MSGRSRSSRLSPSTSSSPSHPLSSSLRSTLLFLFVLLPCTPFLPTLLFLTASSNHVAQAVTIYTTFTTDSDGAVVPPSATNTNTAWGAAYTGPGAYNLTQLAPVPLPDPMPGLQFNVQMWAGGPPAGSGFPLSIELPGNLMGFSIELSVVNQYLGRNSSLISPIFMNYVANIVQRSGLGPLIRIGGNSQEDGQLFLQPFNDKYEVIQKSNLDQFTPTVDIEIDMLYMMNNITKFIDVDWYLGLPFSVNAQQQMNTTGIAKMSQIYQDVLGDKLIAIQAGNEPDLYGVDSRKRNYYYDTAAYMKDLASVTTALDANPAIPTGQYWLGPSVCCNNGQEGPWSIDDVLDAGYLTTYGDRVKQLSVQFYPQSNCDKTKNPEDVKYSYIARTEIKSKAAEYASGSSRALAAGKPFIMFETNTAACSGFSGISDAFMASLWGIDWTLQLAATNFSGVLFHFGGQNASYNAFTPPPGTYPDIYQWTTGPLYYAMLFVSEVFGNSKAAQIVDMQVNGGNDNTGGYVIYEGGVPSRVVLINYLNDPSGANGGAFTANLFIGGSDSGLPDTTPTTVKVKRLESATLTQKFNITWAGQGMGGQFESDGRMKGDVKEDTITCVSGQGCPVTVDGPGAVIVFLNQKADDESLNTETTMTFPTTRFGRNQGPTLGQAVLETSNGRGGSQEEGNKLGSTSHGKYNSGATAKDIGIAASIAMVGALVGGAWVIVGHMAW